MIKGMEKRSPSRAKKVAIKRTAQPKERIASGKGFPSNAQLKDVLPILRNGLEYVFKPKDVLKKGTINTVIEVTVKRAHEVKTITDYGTDSRRVDKMLHRATEVIGNREKAHRWLGTPIRGLGFATPISLLGTSEGAQQVQDILTQMEHGVW